MGINERLKALQKMGEENKTVGRKRKQQRGKRGDGRRKGKKDKK